MPRVTVLDDYQAVALASADWTPVTDRFEVDVVTRAPRRRRRPSNGCAARRSSSRCASARRSRAELLRALPDLELLVTTGMRNAAIDLAAAADLGVTVCGTDGTDNSVPELTIGMIIALHAALRRGGRRGPRGRMAAHHRSRPRRQHARASSGSAGWASRSRGWRRRSRWTSWRGRRTSRRSAPPSTASARSTSARCSRSRTSITIHMPLSERSRGLIAAADLALMKPTAVLVNTSRGPIVDEAALIDALRERRIGGAALDVFDVEPLPAGPSAADDAEHAAAAAHRLRHDRGVPVVVRAGRRGRRCVGGRVARPRPGRPGPGALIGPRARSCTDPSAALCRWPSLGWDAWLCSVPTSTPPIR